MLHPPGFYYVKKPKRFVILSSDKSSERNLSCFFHIMKHRRMEHLQSEEPFSSDPYFRGPDVSSGIHVHDNHIQVWGFFTFLAILAYCAPPYLIMDWWKLTWFMNASPLKVYDDKIWILGLIVPLSLFFYGCYKSFLLIALYND